MARPVTGAALNAVAAATHCLRRGSRFATALDTSLPAAANRLAHTSAAPLTRPLSEIARILPSPHSVRSYSLASIVRAAATQWHPLSTARSSSHAFSVVCPSIHPAVTSIARALLHSSAPRSSSSSSSPPSSSNTGTGLRTADIRSMRGFVIDMDGVLYHMQRVIPGALDFIAWLQANDKKFLFLTNSSERSPRELQEKLQRMGITVGSQHFYTSALATASFLQRQKPNGTAYVIGEPGLISALYDAGYSMNDSNPDYVVVGETRHYSYAAVEQAVKLVRKGARLIGTNCDITDRSQDSFVPACGALVKPIEMASGRQAYFIGKPNPLIMRAALSKLGISRTEACILGDRMDTDILAGIQSEIRTVLILTGVTAVEDLPLFPYRPDCVLPSVGHVLQDDCEVDEHTTQQAPTHDPSHASDVGSVQASNRV